LYLNVPTLGYNPTSANAHATAEGKLMQWRSKDRSKDTQQHEFTGFLDRGVRFEGTLEATGVFRIDAHVKGNVISTHSLVLGEGARVEGQIEGNHVVIAGKFDGVIFAKGRVEIQAKGVVTGEVHSPCLVIEPGGIFDGQCHMLAASESTKPLTIPIRVGQQ
jgi:cytoskeletal protein CcmA (bactofilin family)